MSLPYSYKSFYNTETEPDFNLIYSKLKKSSEQINIKEIYSKSNKLNFITKNSLLGFKSKVKITKNSSEKKGFEYEFELIGLLKIILVLIVFVAFFSRFSISNFLWYSSAFIVFFYTVNIFYINFYLRKLLQKLISESDFIIEFKEKYSEEQKNWLKNPLKCSACGEDITDFDKFCPDCGIKLPGKRKKPTWNLTKYENYRFKYTNSKN